MLTGQLQFLANTFTNTQTLIIEASSLSIEELFNIFSNKFPFLENIELQHKEFVDEFSPKFYTINSLNLHLVNEYHTVLKKLALFKLKIDDAVVSKLLVSSINLETLYVDECVNMNGLFLKDVGNKVNTIYWNRNVHGVDRPLEAKLSLAEKGGNLVDFTYIGNSINDDLPVQLLIAEEMHSLKYLTVAVNELSNFHLWSLENLCELTIMAQAVKSTLKVEHECTAVKKVRAMFPKILEYQFELFIKNFPSLESFHFETMETHFSDGIIAALQTFTGNLKTLKLTDHNCSRAKYCRSGLLPDISDTDVDKNQFEMMFGDNKLLKLIEKLNFVLEVDIALFGGNDDDFVKCIFRRLHTFANRQSDRKFVLRFPKTTWYKEDEDIRSNFSVFITE
ncbi:hypothetical protein B4U80_12710 [Leptotrombidium deliense]|uniref:Uncharacterized protein n=1 Tax=Leptotrombidium deliense TaxID=299467 RepID=A0A443SQ15_9ACAR|nr:hypothetical protein B4U80_12710 [Leptotrombidium deliense]